MIKSIFILRGVSGSGKSTLTKYLLSTNPRAVKVSADDFHINSEGKYEFNFGMLKEAHRQCYEKYLRALSNPAVDTIIVDNTNTTKKEVDTYRLIAEDKGHQVQCLVIENKNGTESVHDVPEVTLNKQRERLLGSLDL